MTLQARIEALSTENLKACALNIFGKDENTKFDAVMAELEIRMGDDFATWADANF